MQKSNKNNSHAQVNSYATRDNSKTENHPNEITVKNLASFTNLPEEDDSKSEKAITQKDVIMAYSTKNTVALGKKKLSLIQEPKKGASKKIIRESNTNTKNTPRDHKILIKESASQPRKKLRNSYMSCGIKDIREYIKN